MAENVGLGAKRQGGEFAKSHFGKGGFRGFRDLGFRRGEKSQDFWLQGTRVLADSWGIFLPQITQISQIFRRGSISDKGNKLFL